MAVEFKPMEFKEADIIGAYIDLLPDSPLPANEVFTVFQETFKDRENAVLLKDEENFHVFYFNSYDTIEEIGTAPPGFFFEKKGNTALCLVIFNPEGNQITCYLPLNFQEQKHLSFLEHLRKNGTFTIHFIAMLYGSLHKMKTLELTVPYSALEDLKA